MASVYNGGILKPGMLPQWLSPGQADPDRSNDITDKEAKTFLEDKLFAGRTFESLYNPGGLSPKQMLAAIGSVPHVSDAPDAPRVELTSKDLPPFVVAPPGMSGMQGIGGFGSSIGGGELKFGVMSTPDYRMYAIEFYKSGGRVDDAAIARDVAAFLIDLSGADLQAVRDLKDVESKIVIAPPSWAGDHTRTLRLSFWATAGRPEQYQYGRMQPAIPEVKQGFAGVEIAALREMIGDAPQLEFFAQLERKDGGKPVYLNKDGVFGRNWIITREMLGLPPVGA